MAPIIVIWDGFPSVAGCKRRLESRCVSLSLEFQIPESKCLNPRFIYAWFPIILAPIYAWFPIILTPIYAWFPIILTPTYARFPIILTPIYAWFPIILAPIYARFPIILAPIYAWFPQTGAVYRTNTLPLCPYQTGAVFGCVASAEEAGRDAPRLPRIPAHCKSGTHPLSVKVVRTLCPNGAKSGFEMYFGPSTQGAGTKSRLESRIKKFTPHLSRIPAHCNSGTHPLTRSTSTFPNAFTLERTFGECAHVPFHP